MQDYPAAHSMDTEWFAVDASGNLAIFNSGEGGAVPKTNRRIWPDAGIDDLDSFLVKMAKNNEHRLINLNIPGDVIAETLFLYEQKDKVVSLDRPNINSEDDYQIYIETYFFSPRKKLINKWIDGWLLLLPGDEVIPQLEIEKSQDNYAVRFSGESTIIFVKELGWKTREKLFEKGNILAGKALYTHFGGLARLFGFFVYEQDSNIPLPYACMGKPIAPLRLEDLPESLQDAVSWNWFDRLQFNETETIQPIEHMPCNTWDNGKWWVDTQGQKHDKHLDSYPC